MKLQLPDKVVAIKRRLLLRGLPRIPYSFSDILVHIVSFLLDHNLDMLYFDRSFHLLNVGAFMYIKSD